MPKNINVERVKQWYKDFASLDLDKVVSIFAEDAVVTYGAGASSTAIDYPGQFVGIDEIRKFYAGRFSKGKRFADIRPFCMLQPGMIATGRWVTVFSQIQDPPGSGSRGYTGPYVQVWSFDAPTGKVTSSDVFYDVDATALQTNLRIHVEKPR